MILQIKSTSKNSYLDIFKKQHYTPLNYIFSDCKTGFAQVLAVYYYSLIFKDEMHLR